MKLKSNGLTIAFLCMVSLPSLTHAATFRSEEIVLLARPEAVTAADGNNALNSNDPLREIRNIAPNLTPAVKPSRARSLESLQALQRHRLDRYYLIDTRAMTEQQTEQLLLQLRQFPAVQSAERLPRVDGMHEDTADEEVGAWSIPDYTPRQHYLGNRQAVAPYAIGGVNALGAWQVNGGKGQGMRVISSEITHWSYDHLDLLKAFTQLTVDAVADYHATASVGIIASQENSFGTTGIVPYAQVGFLQWGDQRLLEMAERLEAGDVMQLGVQYGYETLPEVDCAADCNMPLEYNEFVRDTIAYLTEEKGVHVVLAAANGNINLDHPYFNGYFDPLQFDSGAIYAGAVNPDTGLRSSFSEYGRRVNLFSWGARVTTTTHSNANPTTGYTHTYGGTSSANPIIAGVVASLQGVARAEGWGNIPPKQLREYLVSTGYPPLNGVSTEIGVQPDLVAATEKMREDHANQPPTGRLAIPEQVESQQAFTSHVYAQSPAHKPLTYRWDAAGFTPATGNQPTLTLQAPAVAVDTILPISVEVSDGSQSITLTENITLKAPPITATLFTPESVEGGDQVPVRVEAQSASGKPLNYAWSSAYSLLGPPGNTASGQYTAALVPREIGSPVYVVVSDGAHTLRTPTRYVTIRPRQEVPRPAPIVTGPSTVEAGKSLTLSGTASTGRQLRYAWSAPGFAPSTSNVVTQTFTAPGTAGQYTVSMAAIDDKNQVEIALHPITVTPPAPVNRPPVGSLDAIDSVESGKTLTFTANVSDADGDRLTYNWQRPYGFTGTTGNNRSVTLTAPTVNNDLSAAARVIVFDGRGGSFTGDKTVIVKAPPTQGNCGGTAPWSATKIYNEPSEPVAHKGKIYKQHFWNVNQPPDENNGPWGEPWKTGVDCP